MTHRELSESAAAYALGALDDDERTAFEAHLDGCAECRAELHAFRGVAGALGDVVPARRPRNEGALRERILSDARAVRPITRERPRGGPAATPWFAAAAGLVLALLGGLAYIGGRNDNARLEAELAAARAEGASAESTLAALLGPEVHVVSLASDGAQPAARVFWNHTRDLFIVTAHELPPAPEGRTYQLWAIAEGRAPVSMGTFDTDENGRATAVLPVDAAIEEAGFIDYCALTLEPEGGSPQPTEEPRLLGTWRHVD